MDERELKRLIDHYDKRAEHYEYEYQDSGNPSQERAWMRNRRMADALAMALNAKGTRNALIDLRLAVMELDTTDPDRLARQVKALQMRAKGDDLS